MWYGVLYLFCFSSQRLTKQPAMSDSACDSHGIILANSPSHIFEMAASYSIMDKQWARWYFWLHDSTIKSKIFHSLLSLLSCRWWEKKKRKKQNKMKKWEVHRRVVTGCGLYVCAEVVSFILNLELFFSFQIRYLVAMKSQAKLGAILRQHRHTHTMREGAPVLEVRLATCIHMGKEGGKRCSVLSCALPPLLSRALRAAVLRAPCVS